ncbi:MAG: OsmC family protein [Bacteriovoracaceae bacterium]
MEGKIKWKSKMAFDVENRGIKSTTDATPSFGGENYGPTPKELVLNGIAGCSAIDVVSLLTKMRSMPELFSVDIGAEKTDTTPSYFKSVHLTYNFDGQDLNNEKIIKAVDLSMTRYCGVSYMISKCCKITYDIKVKGSVIHNGEAAFAEVL